MICTGCGKDVPFVGAVCPYCQRDKSSDQASMVGGMIAMVIGGFIGSLIGGFFGMIIGAIVLGFPVVILSMVGKDHSAKQPPMVQVKPSAVPIPASKPKALVVAAAATQSVEDRLRRVDRMKAEGLLSDDEHRTQRSAIIATCNLAR